MKRSTRLGLFAALLVGTAGLPADARASGDCPPQQEQQGLLCYDLCPSGFAGVGPVCWQSCPPGRRDDLTGCVIDAHSVGGNHSGCPWWDKACWVNWGSIKCPPGYGGAPFGTCLRPMDRFWKQTRPRNLGDPLWSIRASTVLRNVLNGLVNLVGPAATALLDNPIIRIFDPIPGFVEFRTTVRDLASEGAGTFKTHASGCANLIQGNRLGIPLPQELGASISCFLNAVRQAAAVVEQGILTRVRALMTRVVDTVRNGAGAVNKLVDELTGIRIPFLNQLLAPLRGVIHEAVTKAGAEFANHASGCPAKLQRLTIGDALAVVDCFGGAIARAAAAVEQVLLAKVRDLLRLLVAAIGRGPEAVDALLTSVDQTIGIPGLSAALRPLRDMAKDVLQKGAGEFVKHASPCPDKLQRASLGDLGAVIGCFANATRLALEAVEGAITEKVRGLLNQIVTAAAQGEAAANRVFDDLAKLGFVLPGEIRKAIVDAARDGGAEFAKQAAPCPAKFQKLLDVFAVGGCFLSAAAQGAVAALDSLVGPIKKCFPKLNLVALFKGGLDLSLKGIVTLVATGADDALGMVGCLAELIFPKPIPGLPSVGALVQTLRMSGKRALGFLDNPLGSIKTETDRLMKIVSTAIPDLMSWMGTVKTEFRALLTLDLKNPPLTPFEPTEQDGRIKGLVTTFLAPLGKLIDQLGDGLAPKEILEYAKNVIRGPAEAIGLTVFRTFLIARAQLMKLAKVVVPALLRGATWLTEGLNNLKLPPIITSLATRAFDTAHELFGGVAAAVLDALGLKDSTEQLVGSLVDAYDEVKGVSGRLGQLSTTANATELLAALSGGMSESERLTQLAKANSELGAAEAAMGAVRQATAAAERTVQDAGEAVTDEQKAAVEAANQAEATAQERVRAATERVEQLDPDKASERTIGTVWETFSEAGLKVVWDTTATIGKLLADAVQKLVALVADVGVGVLATVLSAIPFTTTYAPLITNVVGFAVNLLMNFVGVGKSLFFSMVLPELRALVRDQLISMKSIFVEMYRDPKQRVTLQRFGSAFTTMLDRLGPAADRLKKVRATVKLGMNGLLIGPLGQLFKALPPGLFTAVSKAVSTGMELLRKLASQAISTGVKALAKSKVSGEKIDAKEIATAIITELKDPVIDWLVAQVPEGDPDGKLLSDGLREALSASADTALEKFKTNPASLLNPKEVLGIIADGLGAPNAVKAIARFLTRELKLPAFEGSVANAITTLVPMIKDISKVKELFAGGVLGFLRKIVFILQPGIENIVLGKLPKKRLPVFKAAFDKAFAFVLEPGEFETVLKGGLVSVIAKVVELCQEPVTDLLLTDFPEGTLKEAIRGGIGVLGKKAASPEFIKSLQETGLAAILGEVFAQPSVARAAAELLTAPFGDAALTDGIEKSFAAFASELRSGQKKKGALKNGLRGVLAQFGPIVAKFISGRVVGQDKALEPLGQTLEAAMNDAVTALQQPDVKPGAIKGLGRRLMERVRAVALKLSEKLLAKAGGKETASTRALTEVVRSLASKMTAGEKLRRFAAAIAEVAKLEGAALPAIAAAEVPK